jgi:hypothetical protein
MLTSLSQFQSQGWEKWLSWIGFAGRYRLSTICPNRYKVDSEINLALPPPTVKSGDGIILTQP